jgi:hypothetical protein
LNGCEKLNGSENFLEKGFWCYWYRTKTEREFGAKRHYRRFAPSLTLRVKFGILSLIEDRSFRAKHHYWRSAPFIGASRHH